MVHPERWNASGHPKSDLRITPISCSVGRLVELGNSRLEREAKMRSAWKSFVMWVLHRACQITTFRGQRRGSGWRFLLVLGTMDIGYQETVAETGDGERAGQAVGGVEVGTRWFGNCDQSGTSKPYPKSAWQRVRVSVLRQKAISHLSRRWQAALEIQAVKASDQRCSLHSHGRAAGWRWWGAVDIVLWRKVGSRTSKERKPGVLRNTTSASGRSHGASVST